MTTEPDPPRPLGFWRSLGPGLVTGAADDDPSGIATYSQVGAQFGYGLTWIMLFSYPLMCVIQIISAEIGSVTGCGIRAEFAASLLGMAAAGRGGAAARRQRHQSGG